MVRQPVKTPIRPLPVLTFVLRRSLTFYLVCMSCAAQAADELPQLKVDPSLIPQSRRPAKAVKGSEEAGRTQQVPAQAASGEAATRTTPAATVVEAIPVPPPGGAGVEAAPAPAAAPVPAPAARSVPAAAAAASDKQAGRAVAGASVPETTARNMPALKVDRSLIRTPPVYARRSGAVAPEDPDEPPVRGNVVTARNMPALKVDKSLLGPAPVARRGARTAIAAADGTRPVPGAGTADGQVTTNVPPVVPEDDASLMMNGSITLSEYVARNPESRVTLLAADNINGTTDEVMRAEGSAELRRPGTTLLADTINYEPPTEELFAEGNVRLERGEDVVEGPSLRYRLDRGEGVFDRPRYTIRRNIHTGQNMTTTTGTGQADRMEFLGENRIRMANATYSTCSPTDPDWYAKAESLDLNFVSDDGEGRNGTIYFKDVPILYSPWLDFSLNNRRKSGFLSPTFGTSNRTGIDLVVPYYWNIAPNMDATITPRVLGTRGLMLGNEFRYLNQNYSGIARFDYLPNDRILEKDRYAVSLQHWHQFSPRLSGALNINGVSDKEYFTDLGSRLSITSISYLARDASLYYAGDWWNLSGRVVEYQTLANQAKLYAQLPSVTLNAYRPDLPAGMAFQLRSSVTNFQVDDPTRDEGSRFVFYPQLSLPMQTSYLSVTPKFGVHTSSYSIDRGTGNAGMKTSLSRSIPIFSVDASTVFERDSDLFGKGYVQTLEPRLYYVLSSYKDQSKFPVFDSALADFNFAQIFSENTFVGQDRIADSNQLTAAAVSRFIDPNNGQERARLALGQRVYFSDQRVTLPGGTPRTNSVASTLAALSGELLPDTIVDAAIQYNTDLSQTERYSVSARWNPRPAHTLNTSYRFRRSNNARFSDVRDIDVSAQWPLTNRWFGVARYNYSIAERRLVEGLGGLEYNAGCWVGRAVFQRIATNVERTRTAFFFQLELNDFSRIGSNPLDMLKRSIPGYGQINQSAADPIFGDDF